jgi:hypothetical protein
MEKTYVEVYKKYLLGKEVKFTDANEYSSIATKASRIDFDTFNAKSAVNTKYIIPIIFCLGVSFPPAMTK